MWTGWPASSHAVGTPGRGEDERRGSGRLAVFVDEAAEDIETFNAPDPVGAGARNIDGRGFDKEENRPTNLQIPLVPKVAGR